MKKILLGAVLAIVFGACGNKAPQQRRAAGEKAVKTAELRESTIIKTSTASGILEPVNEVTEVTKTGGKVIEIYRKNGDHVKKDEIILKLENQNTESTYMKAKAKYASTLSDFQTKEINFRKIAELRKEKYISEDEFLVKKAAFDLSRSNLEDAKASYMAAKKDFDDLTMRAEIAGVVTDLDVKLYSQIESNKNVFTVVDDSRLYQKSGVSVSEINGIHLGNRAEVLIEGTEHPYMGKVVEINPVASRDTKKYQVKVEIDNPVGELKKGMYSKTIIESGEKKGYVVPKSAVVVRDLFSYVFVVENGEAREIKVERGYAKGDDLEVISPELQGKLELVVDGQYILSNKDKVKILDDQKRSKLEENSAENSEKSGKGKKSIESK